MIDWKTETNVPLGLIGFAINVLVEEAMLRNARTQDEEKEARARLEKAYEMYKENFTFETKGDND